MEGIRIHAGEKGFHSFFQSFTEEGKNAIDVNKDGVDDFSLKFVSYQGINNETFYRIYLVNADTNQFQVALYPPPIYYQNPHTVKLFEQGEEINKIENYGNNSEIPVLAKIVNNTPHPTDYVYVKWETRTAYVGIKSLHKGKVKYGWIKLAVPSATEAYFLGSCLLK